MDSHSALCRQDSHPCCTKMSCKNCLQLKGLNKGVSTISMQMRAHEASRCARQGSSHSPGGTAWSGAELRGRGREGRGALTPGSWT